MLCIYTVHLNYNIYLSKFKQKTEDEILMFSWKAENYNTITAIFIIVISIYEGIDSVSMTTVFSCRIANYTCSILQIFQT